MAGAIDERQLNGADAGVAGVAFEDARGEAGREGVGGIFMGGKGIASAAAANELLRFVTLTRTTACCSCRCLA